jgi:hypothetical protein
MKPDLSKLAALHEELEAGRPPANSGIIRDDSGRLVMIAPDEVVAHKWRQDYPDRRVVVSQPTTGGNPPHRKGRPEGLL